MQRVFQLDHSGRKLTRFSKTLDLKTDDFTLKECVFSGWSQFMQSFCRSTNAYAKIMQNTKYEQTLVTVFKALPAMPQ